jgi:acetyl-CoA acyltransferase 1
MDRINLIKNHLVPESEQHIITDSDPVIVCAIRSPLTKAKGGGLAKTPPENILSQLLIEILNRTKIPSSEINDIIIGNALIEGCGFLPFRASELLSDLNNIPLYSLNRLCNSGLQAIINANNSIKAKNCKIVIAGGIECMSLYPFSKMLDEKLIDKQNIKDNSIIKNLLIPMGITNENICEKYNISRNEQDNFAMESHIKAYKAQKEGKLNKEIIPIKTKYNNIIKEDDGIRKNININSLSKLKPVFKKNGSTTAGNSSQLTDGAALIMITNREIAIKYNLQILGKIRNYCCVGVPSELMGIGPSIAIPTILKMENLTYDDIDLFEINEAFAGQAIYCINNLNIDKNKVNIHGGATALGHPLGCTGARLVVAMLNQLNLYGKKRGIVSMCVGTGMGAACIIERE